MAEYEEQEAYDDEEEEAGGLPAWLSETPTAVESVSSAVVKHITRNRDNGIRT